MNSYLFTLQVGEMYSVYIVCVLSENIRVLFDDL